MFVSVEMTYLIINQIIKGTNNLIQNYEIILDKLKKISPNIAFKH
ncbi:hypothetical protein TRIP_D440136 [uncultured Paludibacter sp.]|nr:hypothetical protein TRIP_D440136 [uncultured Paludibacter sp.]